MVRLQNLTMNRKTDEQSCLRFIVRFCGIGFAHFSISAPNKSAWFKSNMNLNTDEATWQYLARDGTTVKPAIAALHGSSLRQWSTLHYLCSLQPPFSFRLHY